MASVAKLWREIKQVRGTTIQTACRGLGGRRAARGRKGVIMTYTSAAVRVFKITAIASF